MPTKDPKFVSSEKHEIKTINQLYDTPAPLIYFMQNEANSNFKGKVPRDKFYKALECLGYKKKK